ncbi:hypothetical protein [Treponema sp.]|uniref:hypothetical protein n=1 Tax=Treponema sp. TaxID=166 RepID=UPI00388CFC97
MKKSLLVVLFFIGALVFGQETDADDDFDSIFDDAQDITAEENDMIHGAGENTGADNNSLIKFYGYLDSELGLCFNSRVGEIGDGDKRCYMSEYFSFKNDLSFVSRPDETFAMHGTVRTQFFPIEWATLREIYFDYMASQYCLVSAGKKIHNWGYVRIFNNEDDYGLQSRLTTNIVADSETCASGAITVPYNFMTFTAIALYNPESDKNKKNNTKNNPKFEDISFAGSLEFTFWQASINFYGRRTAPSEYTFDVSNGRGISNVLGVEAKKTFFEYDCYAQNTVQIGGVDDKVIGNIFTGGFYRIWDNAGLNIEMQDMYSYETKKNTLKMAMDLGFRRIGPKKNLKLGIQWRHDSTYYYDKTLVNEYEKNSGENCWVKVGIINSRVLPHVDWKNGVEFFYDPEKKPYLYKVRLASVMQLKIDY